MTNETQQTSGTESQIPFGAKLQSAREAMNLDRKDAAAHLRLHEKYIDMMENDAFPKDMPAIFARGYIRAYGKLLQLSEDTIAEGLAPIQAHTSTPAPAKLTPPVKKMDQTQSRIYVMRGMTAVVAVTMLWMVAAWWNNRTETPIKADAPVVATNTPTTALPITATTSTNTPTIPAPGNLTAKLAKKPGIQIPLRAAMTTAMQKPAAEAPKAPKLNQAKLPSPVSNHAANTKKSLPAPVAKATIEDDSAYDDDDDDYYVD